MRWLFKLLLLLLIFGFTSITSAQSSIRVTVENLQPNDGFFLTPFWVGFHDGSFDYFNANVGEMASGSLESLAEQGDVSGLFGDFAAAQPSGVDGVITGPNGFGSGAGQPPVLDPGEVASLVLDADPGNRFFSYGSMVIPSNDAFIGNDDSMAFEIFDGAGNYNGDFSFVVLGAGLYDAGTEVNDGMGAAFSANGGTSTSEALSVRSHPGLANFLGTQTAAGTTIGSDIGAATQIARISFTAVPEPTSAGLLAGIAMLGLIRRRRRSDF